MSATYTTAISQAKASLNISGDTQFTSAFWANLSTFADAGTTHVLTWSQGTNGDLNSIAHDNLDTHLYAGCTQGATLNLCDFATVTINTWHHYCLTWDGSTVRTYTDGVQSNTVACTLTGRVNWTTITTGRFSGQGQDVVVFTRALSALEVFDLFCNRKPRNYTNIIVYWPLDSAIPLRDFSGNGNDATASGGSVGAGTTNPPATLGIGHPKLEVPGIVNITAAGSTIVGGSAAMTSSANLNAAGSTIVTGTAAMSMLAQLQASGGVVCTGTCVMTSDAPLPAAPSGGVFDNRRLVKKPWSPMRAP